jgi:hypothetical protein
MWIGLEFLRLMLVAFSPPTLSAKNAEKDGAPNSYIRSRVTTGMAGPPAVKGEYDSSSSFFQQAGDPDQNHSANKCHNDGAYHSAAWPDSQKPEGPAA